MALVEEFTSSGNWLFRRRSYLPLGLVVLSGLSVAVYGRVPDVLTAMWIPCAVLGFMIRAYTVGHTPRGTSGRNTRSQIAESLNTTGAYSVVRHPLYVGNFFMGLGVALFTGLWWLAVIYSLAFWIYYERIMFAEEEFLTGRFGPRYAAWAADTPAFIPDLSRFTRPALSFSLRNVLLLQAVAESSAAGAPRLDIAWIRVGLVAAAVWSVLRGIKRRTTWFQVEGR